ncbi:MAG: hypothetical protein KBT03_06040 [Bacteroidales bacterium]|nr:hypothetical protein [Candidatus Scybalousia scybalohippi]
MDDRLTHLYNEMAYREAEETTIERENQMKRIAHEIVQILMPKKENENTNRKDPGIQETVQ